MKTLGTTRWLSFPTLLQFMSGPGEVVNDYNALESIHAARGQFWKLEVLFIGRTAEHRTSLSLDTAMRSRRMSASDLLDAIRTTLSDRHSWAV